MEGCRAIHSKSIRRGGGPRQADGRSMGRVDEHSMEGQWGFLEKRWQGGTYRSAIWRQAESDRGCAAQVSANERGGWRCRHGKFNKAFPGAAHIFP